MKEYLICIIFWGLFTFLLNNFGKIITSEKGSSSYHLTVGYLVYSFFVAIGGIIVQLANLKWNVFAVYLGCLWIGMLIYSVYKVRKESLPVFSIDIKEYIKANWIIYGICLVFIALLFFYYSSFWLGNHLDDGYYITKVATLPYSQVGGNVNYSVGVDNEGFNSYIVNTWEIEASVYVKLLGVNPSLYLRLFQSAFYYFLFLNVVKVFCESVLCKSDIKNKEIIAQYPLFITILFDIYYLALNNTYFFRLRDMFQFNTGMFLGASVVKCMAIFFLLMYYIDRDRISVKMILGVISISVVLISKSTIALPLIVITSIAYLLVCLFFEYGKKGKIGCGIVFAGYVIAAIVLPNHDSIETVVYHDALAAIKSPVIIVCLVIFVLSFSLKDRIVNKMNSIMGVMAVFMLVPQVNDVFESFSIYAFVGGRALTTLLYTFVVANSLYLCMMLLKRNVKELFVKAGYIALGMSLTFGSVLGYKMYGGDVLLDNPRKEASLRFSLSVIKNNKYFIPNSTIALGNALEQLSEEVEEQLYVVTPKMIIMDGSLHSLAVILRTYAPDIIVASAAERFPVNDGSALSQYKQTKYDSFAAAPSQESAAAFEEEISTINANCVVVQNPNCAEWLEKMGFSLYAKVEEGSYYIWYKNGK